MAWPKGRTRVHSAETRAKMSAASMGKPKSAEARARMSAAKKGRPGRKLSDAEKANLSAHHMGRVFSLEHRAKLSEVKASRQPHYTKRTFEYGVHRFRSSYEVRVAQAFDVLGIRWSYEPRCFRLSQTKSYRPDFYLPDSDSYWEVKGYFDVKSQQKITDFRRVYPEIGLVVATLSVVQQLECAAAAA